MSRFLVFALLAAFLAAFVSAIPSGNDQTPLVPSKPHTTASWQLDNCGKETDLVTVESVVISPDPPKPGENLTVTATGTVKGTIVNGSYAQVRVKLGLIQLLYKEFDICEEAENANMTISCPVEPGRYVIEQTVMLPKEIPKAKFTVEVKAFNDDEWPLVCLNIIVNFLPGLPKLFGMGKGN